MSPSTDQRENREFAAEVKFLVERRIAEQIRAWARPRLTADQYCSTELGDGYVISSLYFDTKKFDVLQRNGSFGRSKYRIRRYGLSEVVFLERKLKTRGLVSKRRSVVKLDELEHLAEEEPHRSWPGYWYHRRLMARDLAPVCQISYRRTARVAMTDYGPIRLTLDVDLRAHPVCDLAFTPPNEGTLLLENNAILELKYRYQMPVLFKLLTEEFVLTPQPFSKYRTAMTGLGLAGTVSSNVSATATPGELHA